MVGQELEFGAQVREAELAEGASAADAIAYYLDPGHRRHIARGCTIVANASDLGRANAKARRSFTRAFEDMVDDFEAIAQTSSPESRQRALAAIATCVGSVCLARALTDEALVARLLESGREAALDLLGVAREER